MSNATTTPADDHGHDDHAHDDGHGHDDHGHGGPDHVPHITPLLTYFIVFGALLVLTGLTYTASKYNFGAANLVIALLIATTKGTIVAAWFMHLKSDERMNTVLLCSAFVFLSIFVGLTAIDLLKRGPVDAVENHRVYNLSAPFDEKTNVQRKGVKVDVHAIEAAAQAEHAGGEHGKTEHKAEAGEHKAEGAPQHDAQGEDATLQRH